jgi:hypothetical protein
MSLTFNLFRRLVPSLVLILAALPFAPAQAQPGAAAAQAVDDQPIDMDWMRENYTKSEQLIPMRDGVNLFTVIYAPKDTSQDYPMVMKRTPYSVGPYAEDRFALRPGPNDAMTRDGYIFVLQDVRGCYMSEGEFVNMTPHRPDKSTTDDVDESTDCYDTIEWLLDNVPNNNGRVGMWGISYPGFYSSASMINAHPALKAVSPQAPIADWWYDDFHHHGAFFLPHAFRFISSFGVPRPKPVTLRPGRSFEFGTQDGYHFYLHEIGPLANADRKYLKGDVAFWSDIVDHPNYDEFWQDRNILPHLENVAPAVMTVGGWFDAEDLYGAINTYQAIEAQNPGIFNVLIMGPWYHGGWSRSAGDHLGDAWFGSETSVEYQARVETPFFDHFLKDGPDPHMPEAVVFETGANRWRGFDQWPPAGAVEQSLFAASNQSLSFDRPTADAAFDEFVSDPAKPVPFIEEIAQGMTREYMTDDQRFAARRPDVLVYQTEPLDEDLTVAGPLLADLWVSTSREDADWIVKLVDLHPYDHEDHPGIRPNTHTGGYQMMVRSEVIRGRFRNDPSRPEPFTPNKPTNVQLPLQDVLHTFRKGHRIMIQIQSTWFPLVDRNPQAWVDNIYKVDDESVFAMATHRVYRDAEHPTRISFSTIPQPSMAATKEDK